MNYNLSPDSNPLVEALARNENAIVARWLERLLEDEPDGRFLANEPDRFRNPYGLKLRENLPLLFRALLRESPHSEYVSGLDALVRIRAVREPSGDRAVLFVPLLKQIVREQLGPCDLQDGGTDFTALNARIDGMTLEASRLLQRCRDQMAGIKARAARRQNFVLDRAAQAKAARGIS